MQFFLQENNIQREFPNNEIKEETDKNVSENNIK